MNLTELKRGLDVTTNTLNTFPRTRELSLAITASQTASMWVGVHMKENNYSVSPYTEFDGKRKSIEDIEPKSNLVTDTLDKAIMDKGIIFVVDQLREYLDKQADAVVKYTISDENESDIEVLFYKNHMTLLNIYTNIIDTRLWLGAELGRIRDNK